MWPTSLSPGTYGLLATLGSVNLTPCNFNGDDLWLLDGDGLIIDYVGWPAADTMLTIDNPLADGNYGISSATIHSLEFPNF
jgi:hypothetical protein